MENKHHKVVSAIRYLQSIGEPYITGFKISEEVRAIEHSRFPMGMGTLYNILMNLCQVGIVTKYEGGDRFTYRLKEK